MEPGYGRHLRYGAYQARRFIYYTSLAIFMMANVHKPDILLSIMAADNIFIQLGHPIVGAGLVYGRLILFQTPYPRVHLLRNELLRAVVGMVCPQ